MLGVQHYCTVHVQLDIIYLRPGFSIMFSKANLLDL